MCVCSGYFSAYCFVSVCDCGIIWIYLLFHTSTYLGETNSRFTTYNVWNCVVCLCVFLIGVKYKLVEPIDSIPHCYIV